MSILSVIINSYNSEDTIERAIDSIHSNKSDISIIVVDDGSTDNTNKILSRRSDIIYRSLSKNVGIGMSRKIALSMCNSEYVGFLDSDDEVDPGFYDNLLSDASRYSDGDIIVGRMNNFNCRDKASVLGINLFSKDEIFKYMTESPYNISYISMNQCIYKRKLFDTFEFPTLRRSEDNVALIYLWGNSNMIIGTNHTTMYQYHVNSNSITHHENTQMQKNLYKLHRYKAFRDTGLIEYCNKI